MKVTYVRNLFENTSLGLLRAIRKGLTNVTLEADDKSFVITIRNIMPSDFKVAKKVSLDVIVSKNIAETVEEKINSLNPEFVKEYVLHNVINGSLHVLVTPEFHEMFFAALSLIPYGLTFEQSAEVQSQLMYTPSQVQSYSFWTKPEPSIEEQRSRLEKMYGRSFSSFDSGTKVLLMDIRNLPVTEDTNILFKNALAGIYSDFNSHLAMPKEGLRSDFIKAKVHSDLIKKINAGIYDNDYDFCQSASASSSVRR